MSHYLIIQVDDNHIKKDDRINVVNVCEDPLFNMKADWGGEEVEDEEKAFEKIRKTFKRIATVNKKKRTITFKKRETVRKIYSDELERIFNESRAKAKQGRLDHSMLGLELDEILGIDDLVYKDYCMTAGNIITDYLNGYTDRVQHVGAILDAHF